MNFAKGTLIVLSFMAIYLLTTAQYDNPSNGKTGGPGEGTCTECHVPPNNNINGQIQVTGIPEQVFTGTRYTIDITVMATQGNPFSAGIQLVALDGNNQNAGELRNPRGISGVIQAGDRIYFEHKGGPTKFANGEANWSVDWIAPDEVTNSTMSWYIASILANGDSTVAGDRQLLTNFIATLVEGNAPLTAETLVNNISCGGAADGSISLQVNGGVIPYSYSWNTGDSSSNLSGLTTGLYTVTVSDADTSSIVVSASIEESEMLSLEVINVTSLGCSGQSNATATLSISGGIPPYVVSWPDGDTALIKDNLSVGDYLVVAFDDVGCSDSVHVTVSATINVQPNLIGIDESEPGAGDGLAYINPTGGTPPYLVTWSNGTVGDTISGLDPGTYFVIVGDNSGCLISDTVVIQPGVCDLTITTEKTDLVCNGDNNGSATVTVADIGSVKSFQWSNGDTTQSLNNQTAGIYTIQVIDTIGCVGKDTIIISEPEELVIELQSLRSASCSLLGSAIVRVSGGTSPHTINWSNGSVGDTVIDLSAGDFTAIVTDQNQCSASLDITVSSIDNTPPILQRSEYTLYLDADGTASLSEVSPDSILFDECAIDSVWYSVDNYNCASPPTAVAVQAWDEEGNMLNAAILVNVLDTIPPKAPILEPLIISGCDTVYYDMPLFTDNCGLDTVLIISGQRSGTIFPDGENEIIFQAVDISGNVSTVTQLISIDVDLEYIVTSDHPICAEDSTGSIVILSDLDKNYSFQWNTGLIGDTLKNIPAGNYSVSITDTSGCSAIESVSLMESLFEIQIDTIIPSTEALSSSVEVTILGGAAPFTYAWIFGGDVIVSTEEDLSNISNGSYELWVTDGNGCMIKSGDIQVELTTSIHPIEELGVSIFPNPFSNYIIIQSPVVFDEITVINTHGQIIRSFSNYERLIPIPSLESGIYIIQFKLGGTYYFGKIVKR